MKKIVLILVALITFIAIPATVFLAMRNQELRKKAAPATTLSLSPSTVTKRVGEEFLLEAKINTADNQVVAAEINITFDATKLEAVAITNGAIFPNILSSGAVGVGTASITVGAANTTTPITGTGTAALIKFKALAATTTPVSIRFAPETFVGALGEGTRNVLVSTTPATISITGTGSSSSTITPTPTISITPTLQASSSASASGVQITSPTSNQSLTEQPTITGKASPNSTVTITIYSNPVTATVVTDATGNWKYTVPNPLPAGPHTIVVAALDPITNVTKTATLAFVVSDGTENGASESAMPVSGVIENTLLLLLVGITFIFVGALLPIFITIPV